ncbi:MAG: hypothetical protein A2W31_06290 [Planctomycetes bacterium RBG_16_64_10]|nr:MAG: hypothetical protein A2W31_06290 [Planctomycetes bacterium RBG_16_64_10]
MVALLAVDPVGFLQAIIPIVLLIVWVFSQVLAGKAKQAPPARGRRPGPLPQDGGPAPDNVAAEIEAFLRRVSEQHGGPQPADVDMPKPPAPAAAAPTAPRAQTRRPRRPKTRKAEAVDQVAEALPSHHEVADSVQRHLGRRHVADHADQLGSIVRLTDQQVERRLQATFDHRVGQLERAESAATAEQATQPSAGVASATHPAAHLAGLLQSRHGIRQAILLNEILRRPEHRW